MYLILKKMGGVIMLMNLLEIQSLSLFLLK